MRGRRGQANSWELLLACLLFFFALATFVTLWKNTTGMISDSERFTVFDDTANDVAEKLVRTKGFPEAWTRQNVTVIGLANEPRILNRTKVVEFLALMNASSNTMCTDISNYKCNKHLLGVGKYDFYFALEDINGTTMVVNNMTCTAGEVPPFDVEQVTIPRTAILDDGIARIKLTLWNNYSIAGA